MFSQFGSKGTNERKKESRQQGKTHCRQEIKPIDENNKHGEAGQSGHEHDSHGFSNQRTFVHFGHADAFEEHGIEGCRKERGENNHAGYGTPIEGIGEGCGIDDKYIDERNNGNF